jgi:hypothetical protein
MGFCILLSVPDIGSFIGKLLVAKIGGISDSCFVLVAGRGHVEGFYIEQFSLFGVDVVISEDMDSGLLEMFLADAFDIEFDFNLV